MTSIRVNANYFSADYRQARSRFLQAAKAGGAEIFSYPVVASDEQDLTLDVAVVGPETSHAVVVTSGLHGVEGFFGSAVKLAFLERLARTGNEPDTRTVLVHAVNPYGFSRLRRFNEDNVDLNRNFLPDSSRYSGAPEGYHRLNEFLNPTTPPTFELFRIKALWNIWRYGLGALKESVAGGQYDYPAGIFYGGAQACQSTQIIQQHAGAWVGQSEKIFHLDLHTGLGSYASYKLLLSDDSATDNYRWFASTFGEAVVEPLASTERTAYSVSGHFGSWMRDRFKDRDIRFAGAEFGTYDVIRVLGAIRAENRAFHYCQRGNRHVNKAKAELLECFCPADSRWREAVVTAALDLVDRGRAAL